MMLTVCFMCRSFAGAFDRSWPSHLVPSGKMADFPMPARGRRQQTLSCRHQLGRVRARTFHLRSALKAHLFPTVVLKWTWPSLRQFLFTRMLVSGWPCQTQADVMRVCRAKMWSQHGKLWMRLRRSKTMEDLFLRARDPLADCRLDHQDSG